MNGWIHEKKMKPRRLSTVAHLVSMAFAIPSHMDSGLGHETWLG